MDNDVKSLIDGIKFVLRKKATIFNTGGIRPTNEMGESWIGKVCWQKPNEQQPLEKNGAPMIPIATIFVENSAYVPNALKNIKMITIFMDRDFWNRIGYENYKDFFVIKTYTNLEELVPCNYTSDEILPFPLVPNYVDDEFPEWEDVEYVNAIYYDLILDLEDKSNIDYYNDIFENNNTLHKIGGYPSTIQRPVGFDDGYEFVLQIASDEKADMNIVDGGNFYFGYNPVTNDWAVACDFY